MKWSSHCAADFEIGWGEQSYFRKYTPRKYAKRRSVKDQLLEGDQSPKEARLSHKPVAHYDKLSLYRSFVFGWDCKCVVFLG